MGIKHLNWTLILVQRGLGFGFDAVSQPLWQPQSGKKGECHQKEIPWIASCCFFPSTLPQNTAAVTKKKQQLGSRPNPQSLLLCGKKSTRKARLGTQKPKLPSLRPASKPTKTGCTSSGCTESNRATPCGSARVSHAPCIKDRTTGGFA